ncbi:hypothetical protein Taro_022187 [Colocasia esculenta]|uniref:Uncharacterized protein n=1 Tax=Colocasia esculenta TaxID=4460 RepID=A0A843VDR5_COLES|nr:hypothetical protein [Colocasia esculenta]
MGHAPAPKPDSRRSKRKQERGRDRRPLTEPAAGRCAAGLAPMRGSDAGASSGWQWENAAAGAIAGFATVAALHPLDVVKTRFQGFPSRSLFVPCSSAVRFSFVCDMNDGRVANLPSYRNTGHGLYTIARAESVQHLSVHEGPQRML